MKEKLKKLGVPHTFTLIFILIVITGISTWVVPSGVYDRHEVNGRDVVISGTYHAAEANPQTFVDVFRSPIDGFVDAAEIIGFVLLVGGSFMIINRTGAIEASIGKAVKGLKDKSYLIIPVCMLIFALAGSVTGMAEELIPFYMIFVPLMCSLGYDTLTGVAIVFLGSEIGFMASTTNPFTVGIAQALAQIAPGSGIGYRTIIFLVLTGFTILFVMLHARKVKNDPKSSIVYEYDMANKDSFVVHFDSLHELNFRRLLVLLLFIAGMGTIVFGVLKLGWYISDIAMIFTAIGIIGGIIGGLSQEEICTAFIDGMTDVLSAAFVLGLARAIVVLAQNGNIIDTLLYSSAEFMSGLPKAVYLNLIMVFEGFMSILIPSGSGLASLTIPILAPLSDLQSVSVQMTITAFHLGKGIVSLVTPTSGILITALTVAKIPYSKWFKFVMPLVGYVTLISVAMLTIGLVLGF